ncbi:MAG: NADH-quinone oxidoreductase subunit H [Acidobacteria bacterium]|nr:NADH-quinone oxidoreductase subunit H [Acidobacteriota bacterium]
MNEYLIIALKIVFVLMAVLSLAAILTWLERKQSALMQDRIGANRADIFGLRAIGLFHIIADSLKMFLKEEFVPPGAQRFLHTVAPLMSAFFALSVAACIPFGKLILDGQTIYLQIIDLNAGILYLIAMMSFSIYGVFLAGWASRSKYSLLGALRGASQMLSYEIAMGISLIGIIMIYSTLSLREIVYAQGELLFGFLPAWGVFLQPVGFIIFLTAGMAETKRVPFDLPEGESEIIGYFTEYSSMRFGLFFLTDFIEVALVAMLMSVLFFGGWNIPYLQDTGFVFPWGGSLAMSPLLASLLGILAFGVKVVFFCWLQLTIRWTLPRFRYDQLMKLGWKFMLPLAMANVVATGLVLVLLD